MKKIIFSLVLIIISISGGIYLISSENEYKGNPVTHRINEPLFENYEKLTENGDRVYVDFSRDNEIRKEISVDLFNKDDYIRVGTKKEIKSTSFYIVVLLTILLMLIVYYVTNKKRRKEKDEYLFDDK